MLFWAFYSSENHEKMIYGFHKNIKLYIILFYEH